MTDGVKLCQQLRQQLIDATEYLYFVDVQIEEAEEVQNYQQLQWWTEEADEIEKEIDELVKRLEECDEY